MLIRPYNNSIIGNSTIDSKKFITIDNDKVRLDAISVVDKSGSLFMNKTTHFGTTDGNYCSIMDFIFSETNLNTGEIKTIESSVTNNFHNKQNTLLPDNYIDPISDVLTVGALNKPIYRIDSLRDFNFRSYELSNNVSIPIYSEVFEDEFNLEFSKTIGNLTAIATSATLSIPFRCDIIIDSHEGFNIKNIEHIYSKIVDKSVFHNGLIKFIKSIKSISEKFSNYCKMENRDIRIYLSIREFDTFLNIIDTKYSNMTTRLHLNNSDHIRFTLASMSHLGSKFMNSDTFGDLIEASCVTTFPAIFLFENDRINFEECNYIDNFKVSVS